MTYLDDVRGDVEAACADDRPEIAFPAAPAGSTKEGVVRAGVAGGLLGGAVGGVAAAGVRRAMRSGGSTGDGSLPITRTADHFPRRPLVVAIGRRSVNVFEQTAAKSKPGLHLATVPLAHVERIYLDKIRFVPRAQQLTMLFRDRSHVTLEILRKHKPGTIAAQLTALLATQSPDAG